MTRSTTLTISTLRSWLDSMTLRGATSVEFVVDKKNLMLKADVPNSAIVVPLEELE